MNARGRWFLLGLVLLAAGMLLGLSRGRSAAVLYTGTTTVSLADVTVDVAISPAIARPGDDLQLTAQLSNLTFGRQLPVVTLKLPPGVEADVFALPRGATVNVVERTINWSPVVDAGLAQTLSIPLHVETADTLRPEQPVDVTLSNNGLIQRSNALLWLGIPPIIDAVSARQIVAVGQPVQLSAQLNGPGPVKETWSLADGRTLVVESPVVVFPTVGEHTISLLAENPIGRAIRTATISVVPNPVANFRVDDDTPGVGQPITLFNESGGQPPLRLTWDMGDGTRLSETGAFEHSYAVPGLYEVKLVVENEFGRSEARWPITVGSPPATDFTVPDSVPVGQPLEATALDDGSVLDYEWDMGDGRSHRGSTVRHRYRLPGDYYIVLTARNLFGEANAGRWIRVEPGVTTLYIPSLFQGIVDLTSTMSADAEGIDALDPAVVDLSGQYVLEPLALDPGSLPEEQLFTYLNEVRRQFGLEPLAYSYELSVAAQAHARDKTSFPTNPHVGSDGATAAERLLRSGYPGGYGGEATAWGFSDAREAVEFWMNSESHRVILLNRNVTDLGVGFVEDYASGNIWHWTADFGNRYGAAVRPTLRIQEPSTSALTLESDYTNFSWFWPLPLASDQQFLVYLFVDDQPLLVGAVNQAVYGSRFVLSAALDKQSAAFWDGTGAFLNADWQVRLVDGRGAVVAETNRRPIVVRQDPALAAPLPEPTVSLTPTVQSLVTATPQAQVTPTATPPPPTATSQPDDQPPPLVTATPLP